jgi:alkanesulfonate monooxygenase SsuD/methylene tetrahydromethanopterin reductase-like flavin-dependent oxidoreductase (luciferase family)
VTFEGRYYRFQGLTMEPLLPRMPEVWVGGGGKVRTALSPDKTYLDPAVLRRIAGADGWLARAAGTQAMVKADIEAVRAHLAAQGRDPATLRYGHINFLHLVDARDRAAALAAQRPRFERVMGTHRSFDQLQESYFMGTTAEIVDRIGDLKRAGIEYLVLAPLDYDLEQLDRIAEEIVPRFADR